MAHAGKNLALLFAGIASLAALGLVSLFGLLGVVASYPAHIAAAVASLFALAYATGDRVASWMRAAPSGLERALLSALYGLFCLLVSTILGSGVSLLDPGAWSFGALEALRTYLLKPLYWVGLYGAIPAMLVGIAWGACVKRARGASR